MTPPSLEQLVAGCIPPIKSFQTAVNCTHFHSFINYRTTANKRMCLHAMAGHVDVGVVNSAGSNGYATLNNAPVPKQIDSIYENRLRQFLDEGQYRDLNLPKFYDIDRIDNKRDDDQLKKGYITLEVHEVDGKQERPLFKDVITEQTSYRSAQKGDVFGPSWKTFWFKVHIRVPKHWIGSEQILLQWDGGNEGLLYTTEGLPLQAFTGGEREEFILPAEWSDGEDHLFFIEMACNGMFGNGNGSSIAPPDENRYFRLNKADLVLPNLEARALKFDFWIIGDAAREFTGESWQKYKAREVCNRIMNTFDSDDAGSIAKCREIAREYIGEHVDTSKVYDTKTAPANGKIDVFGIGHCHIDTAWLWPFGETRRKVVRSWTTQIDLMERYPEYQFVASQAQQYKWLNQDHPRVFEQLKSKVSTNQFIPIGGSWVEHDTNIPNGESLVRQFLFGQRFFESQFGARCKTFWLPDTFGYSSQIPQLCRLAGLDRFLTQKLSWNNINNFPNTTFNWTALDGSQVVTHMPPANTYTADANFGDVKRSLFQHKNLTSDQTGLLVFGKGDGGGGPNPEMLEKLRRCRGISNTVGLLPTVHMGTSVDDYFDQLLSKTNEGKSLVTWVGELYFEFHRGTYTSQALVKRLMRKSEIKLHDLEYFASLASILKPEEYEYPTKKIHALWEDVLLCQFHDVLPGSCIELVYKMDVHPMLKHVVAESERLTLEALQILQGKPKTGDKDVFNLISTMQWDRKGVFKIPKTLTKGRSELFSQESGKHDYVFASSSSSSSSSIVPYTKSIKHPSSVSENKDGTFTLENGKLKAIISGGLITSLYDIVNDREVLDLTTGQNKTGANQLVLFEDTPLSWQAWDTEVFSVEKYKYLGKGDVSINESGPLRSSVLVTQKISDASSIQTIISLDGLDSLDDPSMVEFDVKVDWNESRKFLKVEFPVDVHSDYASYETQYGITRRPTHYNTSWDVAKFEVCHHKFADYSDNSYGVSIINDSKYGFSTHGNLMRLSLLRSPKEPDAHADMGKHHFKYALYPHAGALNAKSVELAYNFNFDVISPYFIRSADSSFLDLVRITGDDSLVLSHVKRGEDDHDVSLGDLPIKINAEGGKSLVVRVYEALGGKARGKLVTKGKKVASVHKVNLLEDELEALALATKADDVTEIPIDLRAFEVASYKIVFA